MSCEKCNEEIINKTCGCKEPNLNGCDIKLDFLCAFYSGEDLSPLGIKAGMDGNKVIKLINDYIKFLEASLEKDPTIIQNVGKGVDIYKGLSDQNRHEIKSILKGEGIIIEDGEDSFTLKIDENWLTEKTNVSLESIGSGKEVYKGSINGVNQFKSMNDSDSIIWVESSSEISPQVNSEWLQDQLPTIPDIPTVDYPVVNGQNVGDGLTPSDGVTLFKGLSNKLLVFKSISKESNGLIITEDANNIYFNVPETNPDPTIKTFYVNTKAPANGDGSIVKPYRDFDSAKLAVVGSGNEFEPENKNAIIIIQTSVSTTQNPTINTTTITFENTSYLTYNGTDAYILDSEILYNGLQNGNYSGYSLGPNGELPSPIYMKISGSGGFKRSNGLGLCRWWGAKRNDLNKNFNESSLQVTLDSSDRISFTEWSNLDSIYTEDIRFKDGTLMGDAYNTTMRATTTLKPTTPLMDFRYRNVSNSVTLNVAGSLSVTSVSQTAYRFRDNAIINSSGGTGYLTATASPSRVSYDGTFADDFSNFKVYRPYSNRNAFEIDSAILYIKFIIDEPAGFGHTGFDSFIKTGEGYNPIKVSMVITALLYFNQVFSYNGNTNITTSSGETSTLNFKNANLFAKNNTSNNLTVFMPNTNIVVKGEIFDTPEKYTIDTQGTLSSIKYRPYLTGMPTSEDGLLKGALWRDGNDIKTKLTN